MFTVHVVHGEPVYAVGLCSALGDRGMRVTTQDGLGRELPWHADVFVVDLQIADPASLLAVLVRAVRRAPVLLVGAVGHDELVARCVGLGVSGFVDRRAGVRSIELAISTVVSGRFFVGRSADRQPPLVAGGTGVLSAREYQVLQQIARGLTHSQIARRLQISQHTVDTYVKRIRGKLDVGNKAELTRAAVGLHRPA
jgi:DNA-binding NarL/FixJ family response regulator